MPKTGNLLIVDDNKAIRTTLELLLPVYFERVLSIATPNRIPEMLRSNPDLDVVLLDMNFHAGINTGNEGIYWLREIKKLRPHLSVVLFTAYADIELAVAAIKEGATDFIEKPWNNEKLIITLQNAATLTRNNQKIKNLKELKQEYPTMFWGESKPMLQLKHVVEKTAPTDANILIIGENGTGKEMLAQEIHKHSARKEELLVAVDMGSVTETLFESELFGHAKGAFTDAKTERAGKFEIADGGTLFLDEIGNLPLHLQAKLLAALQSRKIVRVGENVPRDMNIRLITATNCDLEKMVEAGTFREDLFYRINTIVIHLPPLRERGEDLNAFAEIFLEKYAKKYGKKCQSFTVQAFKKLHAHSWPGNIRELQHTVEKAVIMCDTQQITPDDLLIAKIGTTKSTVSAKTASLDEMEQELIKKTMINCEGNISEVAEKLGITRQTLYNKLKKYNL
ncbi:MAG: sigma-54 dependent transcriptional regulator [Bacteroidales bacterium]|jgi:DNA-binding NtrC family response regulator|nr:sigma-54 dependent transcriptional regulator [Bacteroidales bacterium]